MAHQPPPGHGHPAYGNYPPLPPQNQPMMMPLHHHQQFQQPNPHFYVHPQNPTVMQQYVGQPNINAMHHNAANPNFAYQMRPMYHSNYAGFNGNSPVMIQHPAPHQAPPAAAMVLRPPPPRIDIESLQASKIKPPILSLPLTQPPIPSYMEPKVYARKSTRSSALKIVHPDTGEDVVETYRKEKEKSNFDSDESYNSTRSSASIILTVPDIIDKHDKFNNSSKSDDSVATPDLLNQTGYASTSMSLSFIQSEEEDLNGSAEFKEPQTPNEDFQIKNLLKKPKKEQTVPMEAVVPQPVDQANCVESYVSEEQEEYTDNIDDSGDYRRDEPEDDNESVETECLDEREFDENNCEFVEPIGHQCLDLVRPKVLEISTESVSDEETFGDELMADSNEEEINHQHSDVQLANDPMPSIIDKIDNLSINIDLKVTTTRNDTVQQVDEVQQEEEDDSVEEENYEATKYTKDLPKHDKKQNSEYTKSKLLELRNTPLSKRKPTKIPEHVFMLVQKADPQKINAGARMGIGFPHQQQNFVQLLPEFMRKQPFNPQQQQQQHFQSQMQMNKRSQLSNPHIVQNFSKPVIRLSLSKDVKLNVAENAWKPRHLSDQQPQKPVAEDLTLKVEKNFRSILNKLTPENFGVLLEQIQELSIDNQERLERCIILLFEKAISEPLFAPCYARMCQEIGTMYVPHKEKEKVTFRYILVHHCQKEFEKHRTDRTNQIDKSNKLAQDGPKNDKTKYAELERNLQDENNKIRHRAVGTIRFIGELYKIEMLKSHIMMECIKILWEYGDTKSLECLCKLLTTIGKSMEAKGFKGELEEYFENLEEIVNRKPVIVESRIKFMIMDLIDLRNKNWRPRQPVINPTTMNQFRN